MSNKYDGFNRIRNQALDTANFLEATARRVVSPQGITAADMRDRLNDCAKILREAEQGAVELFMKPETE